MKSDLLYLHHILECIGRIESYTAPGHAAFCVDTMCQDAVLRNLHLLTESTQRLSPGIKAQRPDVDWRAIAGFRNVVVHGYLGVDVEQTWQIIWQDLPVLKSAIESLLEEMG